jgi:hypothetical protein
MPVLKHTIDAYKSALIVDPLVTKGSAPVDPFEFEASLFDTLNEFRTKGE